MQTPKLICIDVDGTLLDRKHAVGDRTKTALAAAIEAGHHLALVSGRSPQSLGAIKEELALPLALGTFNGALTMDKTDTIIDQHPIEYSIAQKLLLDLEESELVFFLYTNYRWYAHTHTTWFDKEERLSKSKGTITSLTELEEHLSGEEQPYKLLAMHEDPHYIETKTKLLQKTYGDEINIFTSHPNYIEIIPLATHKGRSLNALASHYRIAREHTVVIGDYYNDVPMFQAAGLAIAMGNAPLAVREHAHRVTTTNCADGVADALEGLFG